MIASQVSGTLFRAPETRTSKNGNVFVTATIREGKGDEVRWVHVAAFGEVARAELSRLRSGDSLTVQGALSASIYERDGQSRISPNVVADEVLPLRRARKAASHRSQSATRSERANAPRQERLAGIWRDERDGPNDSLDGLEAF
jgi:single-stranded DNA-binding protein